MTIQARPPPGYCSMHVPPSQILLALTISNKCGQAFRWHANEVYEEVTEEGDVKPEYMKHVKTENFRVKLEEDHHDAPIDLPRKRRYRKETEWSMCLADRVIFVRQDEEKESVYFRTLGHNRADAGQVEEESRVWLRDYLNLDVPLADMYEEWSSKDPVFARFAKRFTGVRMLRQDPWETLCAFICSSNNNIARIGQMVQNLAANFSDGPLLSFTYPAPPKEAFDDEDIEQLPRTVTYYPFPKVEKLAQSDVEERLRQLSFGYRARYIADTAQALLDIAQTRASDMTKPVSHAEVAQYLLSIREMDYRAAREQLTQFSGVGPKVADCILLMAMDQPSSIPVDRHVFQFAERWYGIRTKGGHKGYEKIADTFRELWGEYAGWAHSVLFTADLRAFQTYKVEKKEEVLLDGSIVKTEQIKGEGEDALAAQFDDESPIEERAEAVITESPRAARWKKRVYEQFTSTATAATASDDLPAATSAHDVKITKTYKGIKRTRKTSSKDNLA